MRDAHISACEAIVAASEPWKRLKESIDFRKMLAGDRTPDAGLRLSCRHAAASVSSCSSLNPYSRAAGICVQSAWPPLSADRASAKKCLSFAEEVTSRHSLHFFLCASSFNEKPRLFINNADMQRQELLKDSSCPALPNTYSGKDSGTKTSRKASCDEWS